MTLFWFGQRSIYLPLVLMLGTSVFTFHKEFTSILAGVRWDSPSLMIQINPLNFHDNHEPCLSHNFSECCSLVCTWLCRFKQEVSAGLQREKSLEQSKAQLQLDWEARMEEVERKAYGKHQQIIQQLSEAKDRVSSQIVNFTLIVIESGLHRWNGQVHVFFKLKMAKTYLANVLTRCSSYLWDENEDDWSF